MDFGKYIAHRGLHSDLVPENSLTAFRLAVEKCLSIELDVRLTKDCRIVVFHDNDLMRMCGIEGKVFDYTYEQLSAFKLKNSDEKIPLLSEVLKTVDGKVPLLIELKGGALFGELESRLDHMMKKYKGEFAVQSFNPFSVMWFRFHSPKVTTIAVQNIANATSRIINASIPAKYLILFSLCTGWRSLIKNLRKHQRLSPFAVRLPA